MEKKFPKIKLIIVGKNKKLPCKKWSWTWNENFSWLLTDTLYLEAILTAFKKSFPKGRDIVSFRLWSLDKDSRKALAQKPVSTKALRLTWLENFKRNVKGFLPVMEEELLILVLRN